MLDSNFSVFSSGTIDQAAGLIDELGGGNLGVTVGLDQWARHSMLQIQATTAGVATMELQPSDGGVFLGDGIGTVSWSDVTKGSISLDIGQSGNGSGGNGTGTGNGTSTGNGEPPPIITGGGCAPIGMALLCIMMAGFYTVVHRWQR